MTEQFTNFNPHSFPYHPVSGLCVDHEDSTDVISITMHDACRASRTLERHTAIMLPAALGIY